MDSAPVCQPSAAADAGRWAAVVVVSDGDGTVPALKAGSQFAVAPASSATAACIMISRWSARTAMISN